MLFLWHTRLQGHGDTVHSVAWSTDGLQLATSSEDMFIRVFDLTDPASKEPKFKRIKTLKIPLAAGFADTADTVVAVLRGTSLFPSPRSDLYDCPATLLPACLTQV